MAGKGGAREKPRSKSEEKVQSKEDRFVAEYLIDRNGSRAAVAAGYSPKGASVRASKLLQKDSVKAKLDAELKKTLSRLEVTRERVLAEYAKMAFADPRAFFRDDGSLREVTELDDDTAAALAGFEVAEIKMGADSPALGMTKKIKWADKKAALDSIVRMMGWNEDSVKIKGDAENPLTMLLQTVAGTSLKPVRDPDEAGE